MTKLITNYRPITLLCSIYKIMTKLILNYRPITLSSPFSKLGVKLGNPDFKSSRVNMTPPGRNCNYFENRL